MELEITKTNIPGLLVVDMPVHQDDRGWFKENWQREKMVALGLPDFSPVQNNISFNADRGTTRGIHAEPWDKYVAVASGKVFGAWVDLRAGESFGQVFCTEIGPEKAVFVPRGVGNAFQALLPATSYVYLVNGHWSEKDKYVAVNLRDESLGIEWPIGLDEAILSEKDARHPYLKEVAPMAPRKMVIVGAKGQLGQALRLKYPEAVGVDREELDITSWDAVREFDWNDVGVIINAAAWTNVDGAETAEGREMAWKINVRGVENLAKIATLRGLTLVHISSDYVFDGTRANHAEDELFSPLSVYGATKAAGDAVVSMLPKHYICRTSWLIGGGKNFVRTMYELGKNGKSPSVVGDQRGRLSFVGELVRAIDHLLTSGAEYGVYNVSNSGAVKSWAEVAEEIFTASGFEQDVVKITTEEYLRGKEGVAVRPSNSAFNLDKLRATRFVSTDWEVELREYIKKELMP